MAEIPGKQPEDFVKDLDQAYEELTEAKSSYDRRLQDVPHIRQMAEEKYEAAQDKVDAVRRRANRHFQDNHDAYISSAEEEADATNPTEANPDN